MNCLKTRLIAGYEEKQSFVWNRGYGGILVRNGDVERYCLVLFLLSVCFEIMRQFLYSM